MIWWMIEQVAGFFWVCIAILLICSAFDIPIRVILT